MRLSEARIGTTRLAEELARRGAARGVAVRWGRALSLDDGSTHAAVFELR